MWTPEQRISYCENFVRFNGKPLSLDPWQEEFVKSRSRYICVLKSRQMGFSFAVALKGLVKAMDAARFKYTKQFVSYNEDDAQEKIRYVKEFYESIPSANKKRLVRSNTKMAEFLDANGRTASRLISIPCRPPRGKGGDICLDEFAICRAKTSAEIYTAAGFCVLRQGCIETGSTPLGTIGKFYEICTDAKKYPAYDRFKVGWWMSGALCRDVKRAAREAPQMETEERVEAFGTDGLKEIFFNSDLDDFRQECECEFVDSAASYISLDLIWANTPGQDAAAASASEGADEIELSQMPSAEVKAFKSADELVLRYDREKHGFPLYAGYDVARTRDAAAIYVIGVAANGKKRSVMNFSIKGDAGFDAQKDAAKKLLSRLPIQRLCMDRTGMGEPLFAELRKEFGERVEGVLFTAASKEAMAMAVKTALERGEYELENNRDFHAQIHSIKRTATAGGGFRYDAERNEKGHADVFWAWGLASWACDAKRRRHDFYEEWAKERGEEKVKIKAVRGLRGVLENIEGADLSAIGR